MAVALENADDADRREWLAERRSGIGGSDTAAILGLSPWATPLSVWLDKRGEAPPEPDRSSEWKLWGHLLEELVAQRYMARTGHKVHDPRRIYRHPEFPHILGTPDRLVIGRPLGLEVKTARSGEEWGPEGTDDIPIHYLAQVAHYMEVLDFPQWDVAALIAGSDFRLYHVRRDREFGCSIVAKLDEWWQRHMIQGERPPIDGSEQTRRWLASKFPYEKEPPRRCTSTEHSLALQLANARRMLIDAEQRKVELENLLKHEIGEAEGLTGEGWRVTWKRARGRRVTDHEAIAAELLERLSTDERADVLARHTRETAGSRRFLFTEAKK